MRKSVVLSSLGLLTLWSVSAFGLSITLSGPTGYEYHVDPLGRHWVRAEGTIRVEFSYEDFIAPTPTSASSTTIVLNEGSTVAGLASCKVLGLRTISTLVLATSHDGSIVRHVRNSAAFPESISVSKTVYGGNRRDTWGGQYFGGDEILWEWDGGFGVGSGKWWFERLAPANQPPDCSTPQPSVATLWPPNNKFVPVEVLGVTDPDGDPVTITITAIMQDEPVDTFGDGSFTPDGEGVGTSTAQLRAERSGAAKVPGNGRMYHVFFTASDGRGGTCSGEVVVSVPHNIKKPAVDDGPLYDSTALTP